jgi:hypothetical protein
MPSKSAQVRNTESGPTGNDRVSDLAAAVAVILDLEPTEVAGLSVDSADRRLQRSGGRLATVADQLGPRGPRSPEG